jgi:hypothetical protein
VDGAVLHLRRLIKVCRGGRHYPKRWPEAPPLEACKEAGQIGWGRPEGVEGDTVLREGIPLLLEGRDMFAPPVIGKVFQPEPLEHCRPFLRAAFVGVERNDTPGNEVVAAEECLRSGGNIDWLCRPAG